MPESSNIEIKKANRAPGRRIIEKVLARLVLEILEAVLGGRRSRDCMERIPAAKWDGHEAEPRRLRHSGSRPMSS